MEQASLSLLINLISLGFVKSPGPENLVTQYKPRRIVRNRLILRDERGRIRIVTKGPCQERLLLTMGARTRLDPKTCQSITRRGFEHTIILSGIYRNRFTGQREYRRYQIFKAERFKYADRTALYNFFREYVPKKRIAFYIFHNGNLSLEMSYPFLQICFP